MGALNYNLKKLNHPDRRLRAELLDTNFLSLDVKDIKQEVELIRQLKPNLNRYVYHTSLNFSKGDQEHLSNDTLLSIAHDYLAANGFTNNQYLIFRHYDAEHPHIHLLVNRITFDGEVVSDSNNYKKSEAILRRLEEQYNLIAVAPSNKAAQKAPTKNEIEQTIRTKKPSDKMLLQELLNGLLKQKGLSVSEFIRQGEQAGICFLFNQASTGRISGITYCYNDFKIKGQSLGNRFKWAEIVKNIDYEQDRDSKAISEANGRTKAKYGELPADRTGDTSRQRTAGLSENALRDTQLIGQKSANAGRIENEDSTGREGSLGTGQDADLVDHNSARDEYTDFVNEIRVQLTDDIDDEAVHGRNRRRKKMARENTR